MRDLHRRIGGVDPLPARAARAADADLEIVRADDHVDSFASGSTATVAVEVWTRPWASVAGTRWTRCTPLS